MMPSCSLSLVATVAAWYSASALCTACAKTALTRVAPLRCALTLTTIQFIVAGAASAMAALALRRRTPKVWLELFRVALAYTLGFLLLNLSLNRMNASFTETVRGLEPLTSFALARCLGARGSQPGRLALLAIFLLLSGAFLSVAAQPAYDPGGLVFGFAANAAFSARGLLVSLLQDATRFRAVHLGAPDEAEVDMLGLFAAQHLIGLGLLIPTFLAVEGTECAASFVSHPRATRAATLSAVGFASYNFLSLMVLLMIDAVSHAVANTLRRAVTIACAAIVFSIPISAASAAAIAIVIGSSILYAIGSAPHRAETAEGPRAAARDMHGMNSSKYAHGRRAAGAEDESSLSASSDDSDEAATEPLV